jgi:hypothetical protein
MAKFYIDGVWYEEPTYALAREKAAAARGQKKTPFPNTAAALLATKKVGGPQAVNQAPVLPVSKPVVKAPLKLDTSKPGAESFDMLCYRGEKKEWWSPPQERLICGMTLYQPWNLERGIGSMTALFEKLRKFITDNNHGNVDGFAQHLRASGRPYALATARTTKGSFSTDYNYVIKIANARTFLWGPKLTIGKQVKFDDTARITEAKQDYIVLNADTLEASTVLAFGHNCGTFEVTFMHDLSLANVVSVNNKPVSQWDIKNQANLTFDEKLKLRKYLRHGTTWLG